MTEKQNFNPNINYQDAERFSKSHEARYKKVDPMNEAMIRMIDTSAIKDKVVLDLRYEARNVDQQINSQEGIDRWFNAKTKGLTDFAITELKIPQPHLPF